MSLKKVLFILVVTGGSFAAGLALSDRLSATQPQESETPAQARPSTPSTPASLPPASSLPDLSSVAERALKVAANITSTIIIQPPNDPWSQLFYRGRAQQSQSLGSGVVVS